MSKSSRAIPKEIAAFGERQFNETGAELVEVLRVKASTIRKLFKKISGISYIVAVISRDRVRVYFFIQSGVLIVGENIDHQTYAKLRKTSRLLSKFEKEKPPTPEELRMEATEELRTSLSKVLRRSARMLGISEPPFPEIYVTRQKLDSNSQHFGMELDEDGTIIFEESSLRSGLSNGLLNRTAFLVHINEKTSQSQRSLHEFIQCVANGFAYAQLKDEKMKIEWAHNWRDSSKPDFIPILNHFVVHSETYEGTGFRRLLDLVSEGSLDSGIDTWNKALDIIHNTLEVSVVQDDYHLINRFCETLSNTNKLSKKKHLLNKIHLAPRAIVNPSPLGITLSATIVNEPNPSNWLNVKLLQGNKIINFELMEENMEPLTSIDYWLDVSDIFPKSAGLISHGKSIQAWVLNLFGKQKPNTRTYEASIEFEDVQLSKSESAVMERLLEGKLEILSNTLIGSPGIVRSLAERKAILLLPNFSHLGISPNLYVKGTRDEILQVLVDNVIEATIFHTDSASHAVVSAHSIWRKRLIQSIAEMGLFVHDILTIDSSKPFLRQEDIWPSTSEILQWSDGIVTQ